MNLGTSINFMLKRAEDQKPEINVTLPELPTPKPVEKKAEVKEQEKTAAKSAREKALEFAERAGRPTSSGIAAGLGTGSILAALGALHRMNSNDDSLLTNPLLLGLLGAAGGYVGGNLFEHSTSSEEPKNVVAPGIVGMGGLYGIGKQLAERDLHAEDLDLNRKFNDMNDRARSKMHFDFIPDRKTSKITELDTDKMTPSQKTDYKAARKVYIQYLKNRGIPINGKPTGHYEINFNKSSPAAAEEYRKIQDAFALSQARKGRDPVGMGILKGKGPSTASVLVDKITKSPYNPINQIKAMNPFKTVAGKPAGGRMLANQIRNILGLNGAGRKLKAGKGLDILFNRRALPARLSALAALGGLGMAGVNAARNIASED